MYEKLLSMEWSALDHVSAAPYSCLCQNLELAGLELTTMFSAGKLAHLQVTCIALCTGASYRHHIMMLNVHGRDVISSCSLRLFVAVDQLLVLLTGPDLGSCPETPAAQG